MEQYFRFILPAIFLVIYIVNQVRKMKKQAEEDRDLLPKAQKPLIFKQAASTSKKVFDYKGTREFKIKERKPMFAQKEVEEKHIVYKPVADEELIAEALLEERKLADKALKQDRRALPNEHLEPFIDYTKKKSNLDWLKDKANLKRTFIAAEIFQRKY